MVILLTFYKEMKFVFHFKSFNCSNIICTFWLSAISFTSIDFDSLITVSFNSKRENPKSQLACEDTNSKLVDIVIVANVDNEDRVGNSLLQIWELRIVHKAKLLFRL